MEYHTPEILRDALKMTPLYNRVMQRMKIQWLGLKLSPPLLLGLGEGKYQAKEKKEWEEAENNARFYPPEGMPSMIPWDVREATMALKEMQKED